VICPGREYIGRKIKPEVCCAVRHKIFAKHLIIAPECSVPDGTVKQIIQ
jgi:hypothetical protein